MSNQQREPMSGFQLFCVISLAIVFGPPLIGLLLTAGCAGCIGCVGAVGAVTSGPAAKTATHKPIPVEEEPLPVYNQEEEKEEEKESEAPAEESIPMDDEEASTEAAAAEAMEAAEEVDHFFDAYKPKPVEKDNRSWNEILYGDENK